MDGWITATATARGRKHVAKGIPNEDASTTLDGPDRTIIAVADGHGAASMTRADRGARHAVAAMSDVLDRDLDGDADLPAALVDRWRELVDADIADDPLDDPDPYLHYGTTAIGGRVDAEDLLLVQIGDGDTIVLARDGTVATPVPDLPPPWPGGTNSLRFDDAAERVAMARVPAADTELVVLATDGLTKRHSGAWHAGLAEQLRADLGGRDAAGCHAVLQRLAQDAATIAADDTTLAILLRRSDNPGS